MKRIFVLLAILALVASFDFHRFTRKYYQEKANSVALSEKTNILVGFDGGLVRQLSASNGNTLRQFRDHPSNSTIIDIFWVEDTVVEVDNLGVVIIKNSNLDIVKRFDFKTLSNIFSAAYNHAKRHLVLVSAS